MLADTRTDIVVADAHQTDGFRSIVGQAVEGDVVGNLIAGHIFESHRQVLVDKPLHLSLYLSLLLAAGLVIQMETHLALLPLYVSIIGTLTAKEPDHGLVQQVLCCMSWRKLFFVMFVQNNIVFHDWGSECYLHKYRIVVRVGEVALVISQTFEGLIVEDVVDTDSLLASEGVHKP